MMFSMEKKNQLGDFIKAKRSEFGLSQRELAARSDVSHGYIANLERGYDHATGKKTNPSVERLNRIAGGLQVDSDALIHLACGEKKTMKDREEPSSIRLPVYGFASCGSPTFIEDHHEEYQSWPELVARKAEGILIVRGTSMEGVGFQDGDLLFVRRLDGERPRSGNKVIASIDGEYTCKIYRQDDLGEYLEAAYVGDQTWRVLLRPGISLAALVIGIYKPEA
jgi:SOS-response transcriptional repressor LexA